MNEDAELFQMSKDIVCFYGQNEKGETMYFRGDCQSAQRDRRGYPGYVHDIRKDKGACACAYRSVLGRRIEKARFKRQSPG